jgi:hypothetical protein
MAESSLADRALSLRTRGQTAVAVLLAGCSVLAGCISSPAGRDQSGVMNRALQRGYDAVERLSTRPVEALWTIDPGSGPEPVSVRILVPTSLASAPGKPPAPAGSQPVVRRPLLIYLPGLGEAASAGTLWREAWATAGCIVVSAQPEGLAQAIATLDKPGADDVLNQAREAFGTNSLARRASGVSALVAEIQRRVTEGDPLLTRIDLTRIIVAGFDIGAQTAMALAGEQLNLPSPLAPMPGLRGVIALSPHVDIARGAIRERFGSVRVPVLAITGTEDSDPWGLINSGSMRRALWPGLPAGDKALLVASGGNHALLAGNGLRNPPPPPWLRLEPESELSPDSGGFGSRSSGRRGNGPAMIGAGRIAAGDSARQIANRPFEGAQLAAIIAVSTAWLDAVLRDDALAREWLARDARRWMGDAAQLELK